MADLYARQAAATGETKRVGSEDSQGGGGWTDSEGEERYSRFPF